MEEAIHITEQNFEHLYYSFRKKEGRIYTDEQLLCLPDIEKGHPYFAEWQLRKESYLRLENYLRKKVWPMKILEVGCGNGWLSHRLSCLPGDNVAGIDINSVELKQAERVFNNRNNLRFIHGDIGSVDLGEFNCIIFAASIQYFASLKKIISEVLHRLSNGGEIHILDSHFYKSEEITYAKQRTADHFTALGFPEMSDFYFHHSIEELSSFPYKILYQPSFYQRQFFGYKNLFPWICIKKI